MSKKVLNHLSMAESFMKEALDELDNDCFKVGMSLIYNHYFIDITSNVKSSIMTIEAFKEMIMRNIKDKKRRDKHE